MSNEYNIPLNLECREEYLVREEHTAKHIGSGEVEVLSTPSMILFMEHTALKCVEKYLPQNYTTVGIRVDVKHKNPAPKGGKVEVVSIIRGVEGRKIVFEVKALWKNIIVGEGIHERFIVNKEKFLEKLKSLMKNETLE